MTSTPKGGCESASVLGVGALREQQDGRDQRPAVDDRMAIMEDLVHEQAPVGKRCPKPLCRARQPYGGAPGAT